MRRNEQATGSFFFFFYKCDMGCSICEAKRAEQVSMRRNEQATGSFSFSFTNVKWVVYSVKLSELSRFPCDATSRHPGVFLFLLQM
jgi:hypothetical protein